MSALCCLFSALELDVDPTPIQPKVEDYKSKTRESMVAKMGGKGTVNITGDQKSHINNMEVCVEERTENNKNLDAVITAVRALITKNDRLISICEKYRWISDGGITYQRVEINQVKVESTKTEGGLSRISLKTTPLRKTKDFGLPPAIPAELADIIVAEPGITGLPDYELFLEKAVLLQDDILGLFLQSLQAHLLNLQAFFQEVATWLVAPNADRAFLEELFQIEFQIPLAESNKMTKEKDDDTTASCTSTDVSLDDAPANVRRAKVGLEILLKEYSSEGSYTLTFAIENGKNQKLVKFIGYLEN
jgi:hypothetical protein